MTRKEVRQLKERINTKKAVQPLDLKTQGLSLGITLANLACTGSTAFGLLKGHFYTFTGRSQAGKTWVLLQAMAEVTYNPNFDDYRIIHDNPERGSLMNIPKYFGTKLAERIESPNSKGNNSRSLENFYDNVSDAAEDGRLFFYGLDSEDALEAEAELKKHKENKSLRKRERDVKGTMGMSKPRVNSARLREAHNSLENGSILVIIKQSRDNVGYEAMFNPETRSGGRALGFYAAVELWFSIKKKIQKTVLAKKRVVGSILKIHVKKTRVAGRDRSVEVHFYPGHGIDDVGSNIAYLVDEGRWEGSNDKWTVKAPEFDFDGTQEKLAQLIQEQNKEKDLRLLVGETWRAVEEACDNIIKRKPKYE